MVSQVVVSIILPVYNSGRDIQAALGRLADTCPAEGEMILVDDGSTDDTLAFLQAFAAGDTRVRVHALERNAGVAKARNLALSAARGEYVWFVDWDDDWDTALLDEMIGIAKEHDADVVLTGAQWESPQGVRYGRVEPLPRADVLTGSQALEAVLTGRIRGYLWAKLFRRDLLRPQMFPAMTSQSDFCGVVPVLTAAARVVLDRKIRYWHVIRPGSITNTRNPKLDNLTRCKDVVTDCAKVLPDVRRRRQLVRYYEYVHWKLAQANTASRLMEPAEAVSVVESAQAFMTWGGVLSLARISLPAFGRAVLIKTVGGQYLKFRAAALRVRRAVARH